MDRVWVVIHGERHEGGDVIGIYTTKESAQENALKVKCHFDGGWLSEDPNRQDYFINGCDFICISEHDVKP